MKKNILSYAKISFIPGKPAVKGISALENNEAFKVQMEQLVLRMKENDAAIEKIGKMQ
jgi:hypothetical protein